MESNNTHARLAVGRSARPLSLETRAQQLSEAFADIAVPDETPMRVARWLENYAAPHPSPAEHQAAFSQVIAPVFENDHDELVIVKDVQFIALCEHHLLPFSGHAAVGYIPNGRVVGLSKVARAVNYWCQWPSLQEAITTAVANSFETALEPKGIMVVLYNVMHSCMTMRGVKDPDANTTTSAIRGVFRTEPSARAEFLQLLAL